MSNTNTNIGRILSVMADGKWRTINVIKEAIQNQFAVTLETKGLAAQLRDIRKKLEYVVNVNKVKEGPRGTWEYQVLSKGDVENGNFVTATVTYTGCDETFPDGFLN